MGVERGARGGDGGAQGEDRDFRFSPRPNRAAEITWRPWGAPAFAEARRLGRPVLLSLSAVWCHWCHVMDETSYSNEQVIALVNRDFVPIRVDNDRHPDVNRRYNMGGWPSTAFLTGDGEVVTGATYIPPHQMIDALERVRDFYASEAPRLRSVAAEAGAPEATASRTAGPAPPARMAANGAPEAGDSGFDGDPDVPGDIPAEIALSIVRAFDQDYGGFGTEPKFPQTDVLEFVLAYEAERGAGRPHFVAPGSSALVTPLRLREILHTTLERMSGGAIHDHVAGGFFRYATRRDWSEPHYEKMLLDNVALASLYADAVAAAGRPADGTDRSDLGPADLYARTAGGVFDYLLTTLWRADRPAFGGSQDADESYYKLGAEDRAAVAAPFVDETLYVDWNGAAAQALLRGAVRLGRPELAERAAELLDGLLGLTRADGALPHFVTPGGVAGAGTPLLADQVAVAAALLDLYEWNGRRPALAAAEALAGSAVELFRGADGRYVDRLVGAGESPGLLARPVAAIEDNARLADVLLRLETNTGQSRYRALARDLLLTWSDGYAQHGIGAAAYGRAILRYLERPAHTVVVGAREHPATRALLDAGRSAPDPLRTVQLLDPADADDAAHMFAAGYPEAAAPAAYVCRGRTCEAPLRDPAELAGRLARTGSTTSTSEAR